MAKEIKSITDEDASPGSTEKEEIIELTDEIKVASQNNDDIIELVDEVMGTDPTTLADDADDEAQAEPEITAVSETGADAELPGASESANALFSNEEIKITDDIDEEMDLDEGGQDDFVNSLGMDLETDSAMSQLPEDYEPISAPAPVEAAAIATGALSPDQIEAAVERVIMKILSEKIDSILSAAIEKTLTREIDKIKALLLDDSSGDNV